MKQVENIIRFNTYADSSLINNYMYMKRDMIDFEYHYIFRLDDIITSNPPEYIVYKCYVLQVPKKTGLCCNVKDDIYDIQMKYNDTIYILELNEYIELFRSFVKYEGLPNEKLPGDIIKNSGS